MKVLRHNDIADYGKSITLADFFQYPEKKVPAECCLEMAAVGNNYK